MIFGPVSVRTSVPLKLCRVYCEKSAVGSNVMELADRPGLTNTVPPEMPAKFAESPLSQVAFENPPSLLQLKVVRSQVPEPPSSTPLPAGPVPGIGSQDAACADFPSV